MTHATAWRGFPEEAFDWLKRTQGVKNGVFDISYLAVDWYKVACSPQLIPEADRFRNAMFDGKNALAFAEIPGKVVTALETLQKFTSAPSFGGGYRTLIDFADIVGPVADASEFWNARIAPIDAVALSHIRVLDAATLAITMTDNAGGDFCRVWRALKVLSPAVQWFEDTLLCRDDEEIDDESIPRTERQIERAWDVLALNLIDLARSVSFVALGTLVLVSTFYGAIASGALLILAAATSALAFTIIGEFAQRAVRERNPDYPRLPDVLHEPASSRSRADLLLNGSAQNLVAAPASPESGVDPMALPGSAD